MVVFCFRLFALLAEFAFVRAYVCVCVCFTVLLELFPTKKSGRSVPGKSCSCPAESTHPFQTMGETSTQIPIAKRFHCRGIFNVHTHVDPFRYTYLYVLP